METKLFEDQSDLADEIKKLNNMEEEKCVKTFRNVAMAMAEDLPANNIRGCTDDICYQVLCHVSFYPAKPAVLHEELRRLGLKENICASFSAIWAEYAKKIVVSRRKVSSELKKVDYEILRDVQTQEQNINLYLKDRSDQTTLISFTPSQMFAFYEQLESIQTSIDSICK